MPCQHSPVAETVFVYVESGVNLASTGGAAAWTFDLRWWAKSGKESTNNKPLKR